VEDVEPPEPLLFAVVAGTSADGDPPSTWLVLSLPMTAVEPVPPCEEAAAAAGAAGAGVEGAPSGDAADEERRAVAEAVAALDDAVESF
jgi:hypothetical protein